MLSASTDLRIKSLCRDKIMLSDLEKILLNFIGEHYATLPISYDWKFSIRNFPEDKFKIRENNPYDQSKKLRLYIHSAIKRKVVLSTEYQKWYVRYWGGVRGNKESTIETYINMSEVELERLGAKGVATWSKILCLRDPKKFAIYDARVALSLNSLQKREDIKSAQLFPQLPSRNSTFVVPAQRVISKSKFFDGRKMENFYSVYMYLLQRAAERGPWDIQDIEMALFSHSSSLSKVWLTRD